MNKIYNFSKLHFYIRKDKEKLYKYVYDFA